MRALPVWCQRGLGGMCLVLAVICWGHADSDSLATALEGEPVSVSSGSPDEGASVGVPGSGLFDPVASDPKGVSLPVAVPSGVSSLAGQSTGSENPLSSTTVVFSEDFESGSGAWTETGGLWQIGAPIHIPNGGHNSSSQAAVMSP